MKYQLIEMSTKKVIQKGGVYRIGESDVPITDENYNNEIPPKNHSEAIKLAFERLGGLRIDAFGHRVVHGGSFCSPTLATDKTIKQVEDNSCFAPIHNPVNLLGVLACKKVMPKIPNVMVFDTAFHSKMPEAAYLYGISFENYRKHGIRRYGFHGPSHDFVSQKAAELSGKPRDKMKIISLHLGNGCSICAIDQGKSVETSMGLTPLEGLVMGTRSGDIDPAAIGFLGKALKKTHEQTIDYLNKESGLYGMANIGSNDTRDIFAGAEKGNKDCGLAVDVFVHRLVKYVGAYAAVMNGVDAIVFTAGTGNNSPLIRRRVVEKLGFIGAKIDESLNNKAYNNFMTTEVSAKDSKVKVFAIETNEELLIAMETAKLVGKK